MGWLREQFVRSGVPACERHSAEKRAHKRADEQSMAEDGCDDEGQEECAESKREKRCHVDLHLFPKARYSLVSLTSR